MTITTIRHLGDGLEYLYVGRNTTEDTKLLSRMRTILISLCGGLMLVAGFLGYLFAGRAMIPITRAFKKLREFTADASHELRAPLTVMKASVEVVQEHEDLLPPFHREALRTAKAEVGRMAELVDHLLTLARSDAGMIELQREKVDAVQLVQESTRTMRAAASMNGVSVQVHDAPAGNAEALTAEASLIADRKRIKQLMIILIDNAIKYNVPGGTVELNVRADGNLVAIAVKDSGIGIAAEDLPNIFDRFYRADKSRDRSQGGTGLGLSIAQWIVSAHGGSMTVESELGVGSTFTVQLPTSA
ncbi:sensor histidine kinase [Cohnella yongneupensis]|uniref:histidine kinase n=1 Tax=Cohnella yongneupensis TaxID=425006 RepID=A0ABW0R3C0_9BACL